MDYVDDDFIAHYGTPRHSGRYPWGSGKNPYQSLEGFYDNYLNMKAKGLNDTAIAKSMGLSTGEFRDKRTIAMEEERKAKLAYVKKYLDKGWSVSAIARKMGANESSVRNYRDQIDNNKLSQSEETANLLKDKVNKVKYLDVGEGTAQQLGITDKQFSTAVQRLREQGYNTYQFYQKQAGTGKYTSILTLVPPGVTQKEMNDDIHNKGETIQLVTEHSNDGGRTFEKFEMPTRENGGVIDSSRLKVVYGDEGGTDKDGLIEIRPGCDDLSLGGKHYAQVRIDVDGTHYLKGMAVYSNDLPDGIDIRFNTNKHSGTPALGEDKNNTVLKQLKSDPTNPFGASVIQQKYKDKDGKTKLNAVEIVGTKIGDEIVDEHAEGGWENWRKALASQFVAKQTPKFARTQLNLAYADKAEEYDEISKIAQPNVRKVLLDKFAASCDKDSYELKAAALPRQSSCVILPFREIKDGEVYAPQYKNGEKVLLVRFPHAGTFESPLLTVNNNVKKAEETIGKESRDAIGINSKTAGMLSGADFDGDTVLVLPAKGQALKSRNQLKSTSPLASLKDFNPSEAYPAYKGMKTMTEAYKQKQMGVVSNLITDMTLKGASDDELARAVKHSMVVIDAVKHNLDYKRSEKENGIAELKEKYQSHIDEDGVVRQGASTLISRAKNPVKVNERRMFTKTDPETGKAIYIETGNLERERKQTTKKDIPTFTKQEREYYEKTGKLPWRYTGKTNVKQVDSKQMLETDDARTLSSGTEMENIYASHANKLKALANKARLASLNTSNAKVSKSAKDQYADEVASLNKKLNDVVANKPYERRAQNLAAKTIKEAVKQAWEEGDPLDAEHKQKVRNRALNAARAEVGAKHAVIDITPNEWKAISSNALPSTTVNKILASADLDQVRSYAMPRDTSRGVTGAMKARINAMRNSGYTIAEIADSVGLSTSTISKTLKGE